MGTGSSASDKPVTWNLYKLLSFLDNVKQVRTSHNTLESVSDSQYRCHSEDMQDDNDDYSHCFTPLHSPQSPQLNIQKKTAEEVTRITSDENRGSTPVSTSLPIRQNLKSKRNYNSGNEERAEKRLKILESLQNKIESEDEIDLFMKSIGFTIKRLPLQLQAEAKLGILKLVTDLQFKNSFHTIVTETNNIPVSSQTGDSNISHRTYPETTVTTLDCFPSTSRLFASPQTHYTLISSPNPQNATNIPVTTIPETITEIPVDVINLYPTHMSSSSSKTT